MTQRVLLLFLLLPLFFGCGEEPDPYAAVTLSRGDLELTVDPVVGGRLASLKFRGQELLQTTRDSANLHWGSVAWTSPQADWGWPPPPAFDSAPFLVTDTKENRIILEGPLDSASMLRMRKRYVLTANNEVGLTYWVTNESAEPRTVALWENTRLPYAGRIEFAVADSLGYWRSELALSEQDSVYTLHLDDRHAADGKIFTSLDSGYVDYLVNGIRLRKESVVTDWYRVAPGQAPLEIYADPAGGFTELELQGDLRTLQYGESNNLRVRWTVGVE